MIRYLTLLGVLAFLAASPSVAGQRKEWCGTLGEKSIVIRNEFLFYPPEREGDSWSAGSTNTNPTQCDQKLKSVVLEFYYPTMEAAGARNAFDDPDPRHVQLALSVLPAAYSRVMLNTRLARYVPGYKESNDKKYELFAVRSLDGKSRIETLWRTDGKGETDLIVVCRRVDQEASSTCKLNFVRHDIPAEINVGFGYKMLSEWPAIMVQANLLIDSLHK
jgi:hypothetical protein